MGQWAINVVGQGVHHNGAEGDADKLFEEFVAELRKSQTVLHASLTIGSRFDAAGNAEAH